MDDIPEALRDQLSTRQALSFQRKLVGIAAIVLGAIALLIGIAWLRSTFEPQKSESPANPSPSITPEEKPVTGEVSPTAEAPEEVENILGHLPYEEAPTSALKSVTPDGGIRLRKIAADKFLQMQAAARANGIILTPLSGFRTVSAQEYLFFQIKEQRVQDATKRAEVSAPPGYSEHHTGYTIDIGDGNSPATNLSSSFENTPAFHWLEKNAAKYSFELSFPRDNPQGISYEPWHWRFVGDIHSLETFYKARNLNKL